MPEFLGRVEEDAIFDQPYKKQWIQEAITLESNIDHPLKDDMLVITMHMCMCKL